MSTEVLREAGLEDVDKVLGFVQAYYQHDDLAFDADRVRRALRALLQDETLGRAWLVQFGGQDVGHVILTFGFDLEFGGRTATVTEVFITAARRSVGLGTAVFAALERYCEARQVLTLELQAERKNLRAKAFYERLGFQAHDRVPFSKPIRIERKTSQA